MEFIAAIPLIGPVLATVIPFVFVLSVVVFVHEYGHYIVGRWCGIKPEVFSVGFGKELVSWTDKRGTRWRIAALPLGGYVRFLGDKDAASAGSDAEALSRISPEDRERTLTGAKLWKRAATVAAGPMANFLLTAFIMAASALWYGMPDERPVIGAVTIPGATAFEAGDRVLSVDGKPVESWEAMIGAISVAGVPEHEAVVERDGREIALTVPPAVQPVVSGIDPRGAAAEAGMELGDRMLSVDGRPIASFRDLQEAVIAAQGGTLNLDVARGGAVIPLALTPRMTPFPTADGGVEMRPMIGVTGGMSIRGEMRPAGVGEALVAGVTGVRNIIVRNFSYLKKIFGGEADASGLGGPIRIATMSGDAAQAGIAAVIGMIAMISTSVGLANLLPVPVLDGGHLVFYAIEAVRGKPLPDRAAEAAAGFGLALVLALMAFVTWNDLNWM